MDLLIVQHEPHTTPGTTYDWAKTKNLNVYTWKTWEEKFKPEFMNIKSILVCGGGMDTHEFEKYPWMLDEKKLIQNAVQTQKKYFGICLGSQLLAEVLGAKVFKCEAWEIGWWPVQAQGKSSLAFHWHRYNFEIPANSRLMITSDYCTNQGFIYNKDILAVQFHPEVDAAWLQYELENYNPQKYTGQVQSREEIIQNIESKLENSRQWYWQLLDEWYTQGVTSL